MASQQDVAKETRGSTPAERRGARADYALRPPVDVFETNDGITLEADMPGVSKDRLNLKIDNNTLLLEGSIEFPIAGKMEALYADVRSTHYRASFALSI